MNEATMSLQEMFLKAKSGEVQMHSALGTRDESRQTKTYATRIQKMKTVCGINHRALVIKDIVLPFNPFTGAPDEIYNQKTPFRPILLVSQVIEQIKKLCADSEEMAGIYAGILGKPFSDGTEVSYEDYLLFKDKGFIKPRITTYDVVAIDFNGRCGFPEFKVKYTVDPKELNSERTYDPDKAPVHHQLAILFNSICREEWKEKETQLKIANATKDQMTSERQTVFSKSPISFVKPQNLIPFFFFDFNKDMPEPNSKNFMDIEKEIRFYSYTDKWTAAFDQIREDASYDELIDFYDFTIKTPKSGSPSASGAVYTDDDANAIYQAMSITNTDARKSLVTGNKELDPKFIAANVAIQKYFEYCQQEEMKPEGKGFEQIMAVSNRFRPIESVSSNILQAANEIFNERFATSPYFTSNIKKANAPILTAMNPSNVLMTAEYDEDEMKEAEAEQNTTLSSMITDTIEGDLEVDEFDLGVAEIDLDTSKE